MPSDDSASESDNNFSENQQKSSQKYQYVNRVARQIFDSKDHVEKRML